MSREKTTEEVREEFLKYIWAIINYWDKESGVSSSREKLEGLAHSILATLDGCAMTLPAFIVAPYPHPDDRQYHIDEGTDYYPENDPDAILCDIAGGLHELMYKYGGSKNG